MCENNISVRDIERSIIKKYRKTIWVPFIKAIKKYELISDNDKIAVCISGGKDSMLLAKLMEELLRHGKKNFELVYLSMDPGYNEENNKKIMENAEKLNLKLSTFHTEIFDTVNNIDGSPCYLCARMRRGYLYSKAKELGCNKIALGHHFDDVIETILMSILYSGQIKNMPPKLHSQNFEGMELIRPLYMVREEDIINFSKHNNLDFIRCACRFTENNYDKKEGSSMRLKTKELIRELEIQNPIIPKNIFKSVENVHLDTMINYKKNGKSINFLDEYWSR